MRIFLNLGLKTSPSLVRESSSALWCQQRKVESNHQFASISKDKANVSFKGQSKRIFLSIMMSTQKT